MAAQPPEQIAKLRQLQQTKQSMIHPHQYYQTDTSSEKLILQLENTQSIGLGRINWLPILCTHSNGDDPRLARLLHGESDKLNLNLLVEKFERRLSAASQIESISDNDKKIITGEIEQITKFYKSLRDGSLRYFRKRDILEDLDKRKQRYGSNYENEELKKQRDEIYQQFLNDLGQLLEPTNVLRAYLTQRSSSPMPRKLPGEVAKESLVISHTGPLLDSLGLKVYVNYNGKGQATVVSGPRALMSKRLEATQEAIALIAADQTNAKGKVTGTISISTDSKKIAENSYIYARQQGFAPGQIQIKCKDESFVIRYDEFEKALRVATQQNDKLIREALKSQHPNLPDVPATDSLAFESSSSDGKTNKSRTVKATLANQSALGTAFASSRDDKEIKRTGDPEVLTEEHSDEKLQEKEESVTIFGKKRPPVTEPVTIAGKKRPRVDEKASPPVTEPVTIAGKKRPPVDEKASPPVTEPVTITGGEEKSAPPGRSPQSPR